MTLICGMQNVLQWRREVVSQLGGFYRILEEKIMITQARLGAIE